MRRIVHLSDLHFGRARPELLEPLVASVNAAAPHLVAISGDLTQRARDGQFREARAFLDRLEAPWLAVPGNHDLPLDDLAARLLDPWSRYRRWIARELEPRFSDGELAVVGINTADPFGWQRGRLGRRATLRACAGLAAAPPECTRVVVAHHPFEHGPGARKALMRGAARGMGALASSGADIVLSGHLHTWHAEPFAAAPAGAGALQVHAGTGLSTRVRGEDNDFNLLTLRHGEAVVERFVARPGGAEFVPVEKRRFRRGQDGWTRAPAVR
jgi:3',5'-cyclic AMP phosphodiesterase CpdA